MEIYIWCECVLKNEYTTQMAILQKKMIVKH
jgi:hypothetical protein